MGYTTQLGGPKLKFVLAHSEVFLHALVTYVSARPLLGTNSPGCSTKTHAWMHRVRTTRAIDLLLGRAHCSCHPLASGIGGRALSVHGCACAIDTQCC
jgi:hypothetical protein